MRKIKEQLILATLHILRPIARILLKNGISLTEFSEIGRRAFVDVGFEDFGIEGRRQTVSRVAVLTGLSRKEVLRLKTLSDDSALPESGPLNRAARVISGWLRDPEFCSQNGEPRLLPPYGKTASFSALVKRYSGDITPGAILDELIRVGAVAERDEAIELLASGYIPKHGEEEKIKIMGICATDLLTTLEHNLVHDGDDARFQRAVVYHDLSGDVVRKFEQITQERANKLLVELNEWLAEQKKNSESNAKNKSNKRIGLGIYYFENQIKKDKNNENAR